jgi:methylphosphotriester-DNA--protein-cysteine methyltransferase
LDNVGPRPDQSRVTVRSFDDIAGYEHSMRLATTSMVVREAANFNGWHAKIDLGHVRLNSAEYSASLSTRSTVRWPRFFFLTGNGRPARVSGHDFDHGMINFMAEHGAVSMVSDRHMAWTSIEFDPDRLTTDFQALHGRPGSHLTHGAMFVPGDTANRSRLMDVCRSMLRLGMTDAAGFEPNPAAVAAAGVLIEAVTACATHGTREADRAAAGRHHVILRRMIDAIEADHRAELTMVALCLASNVSAHTLHEISMSYLGMPPARYLRNHRLRLVHETLRDAAPGSVTVAAAMTRHGIWQAERAACAYQEMFGQSPTDTLNKVARVAVIGERSARPARRWA